MKRIRTTGEYSLADGNASGSQKLLLTDKASQWTDFLANHQSLLAALVSHDGSIGSKEPYIKVVETVSASVTLDLPSSEVDPGDIRKIFLAISGGDNPVVLTLPTVGFGSVPSGMTYIAQRYSQDVAFKPGSGDSILMPWGSVADSTHIQCDDPHGVMCLVSDVNGAWVPVWATGTWYEAGTPTKLHRYDGNVDGATENNIVTFDAEGNIKDSGSAVSDFAADTHATEHLAGGDDELKYRGEVFMPIADALDYSEDAPAALENLIDSPGVLPIRKFDPTTQEETSFLWEVPDDIVAADGIKVTVVGAISEATAPASEEGVSFKIAGYCVGHGDQLGGTFGTAQESKDADLNDSGADTQYDRFKLSQSATITVTNLAPGELAFLKVYRDVADTDDDYGQDVGISGIRILYNKKPIAGW